MILFKEQNIVRRKPVNFLESDALLFESEWEKEIPSLSAHTYTKVIAFSDQTLFSGRRQILAEETRVHTLKGLVSSLQRIRKKTVHVEEAVWLTDTWSSNYFHWFTDVLPRILVARKAFVDIPLVLPANYDQFRYIVESLATFPEIRIIWLRNFQKLRVRKLHFIPHTAPTGNYNEGLIRELRDHFLGSFQFGPQPASGQKIMISRQSAPSRKVQNWDSLIPVFENNDVQQIIFEKLSWKEQVEICAGAKCLLGTHGAGLTNMLFMKKGAVLEFRRKDDVLNNCYFSLASALNLDYYYLLCDVDDPEKTTQKNDFHIDPDSMEKLLSTLNKER